MSKILFGISLLCLYITLCIIMAMLIWKVRRVDTYVYVEDK